MRVAVRLALIIDKGVAQPPPSALNCVGRRNVASVDPDDEHLEAHPSRIEDFGRHAARGRDGHAPYADPEPVAVQGRALHHSCSCYSRPASSSARLHRITSSSIPSSVVVASKPKMSRAFVTSGTRSWTSCSNGGCGTQREGRSRPLSLCQIHSGSSRTLVAV